MKRRVDPQGHPILLGDELKPDTVEFLRETGDKADLTITVMSNPINDGRQFDCRLTCPLL